MDKPESVEIDGEIFSISDEREEGGQIFVKGPNLNLLPYELSDLMDFLSAAQQWIEGELDGTE